MASSGGVHQPPHRATRAVTTARAATTPAKAPSSPSAPLAVQTTVKTKKYPAGSIEAKILDKFGTGKLGQEALCIAKNESGFRPDALYVNKTGSRDRGVFQINDKYHPHVTDAQAYDVDFSIKYAYKLRMDWGNWNAWMARTKCGL